MPLRRQTVVPPPAVTGSAHADYRALPTFGHAGSTRQFLQFNTRRYRHLSHMLHASVARTRLLPRTLKTHLLPDSRCTTGPNTWTFNAAMVTAHTPHCARAPGAVAFP